MAVKSSCQIPSWGWRTAAAPFGEKKKRLDRMKQAAKKEENGRCGIERIIANEKCL